MNTRLAMPYVRGLTFPLQRLMIAAVAATLLVPACVRAQDDFFDGVLDLANLDGSNGFVLNGIVQSDETGCSVAPAGDFNGDGVADLIIGARFANTAGAHSGASYLVFGKAGVGSAGAIDLDTLDGSNGFVLTSISGIRAGEAVSSAGDVNDDGFDDVIIGAPSGPGASYVVFGGADVGSAGSFDLASLNGSNGFVLNGIDAGDFSGSAVSSAGDFNDDGIDDLIIGARTADPGGNMDAGESYVVFGSSTIGSGGAMNLSSLNGSNGFVLNGADEGDWAGSAVAAAGDVNNDGVADLIIGARDADPGGNGFAGETYVVFGGAGVGSAGSFDLASLNGSNGFVLNGIDAGDRSGFSVASAGEFNNDGINDLLIGAPPADPDGKLVAGESYVVFGGAGVGSAGTIELGALNGSNGFVLKGVDEGDNSGFSVASAGDVNGDGIADVMVGARLADPGGDLLAGETYVVFGGAAVGSAGSFELASLDGSNGFVLYGVDPSEESGYSVASAGDVNADGIDDMLVGAPMPSGTGPGRAYVIFGARTVPEPNTMCLVVIGSLGIIMLRSRCAKSIADQVRTVLRGTIATPNVCSVS